MLVLYFSTWINIDLTSLSLPTLTAHRMFFILLFFQCRYIKVLELHMSATIPGQKDTNLNQLSSTSPLPVESHSICLILPAKCLDNMCEVLCTRELIRDSVPRVCIRG
uniref:PRO2007 n=1 Tax=Homo sapiens TaxID=9606 RepID=Q9P1F5_HUMAN|nr:PRO2007 [Homo sapiens]